MQLSQREPHHRPPTHRRGLSAHQLPTTPDEAADTEEQVHSCVRNVRLEGVRDVLVHGDVSCEDDAERVRPPSTEIVCPVMYADFREPWSSE